LKLDVTTPEISCRPGLPGRPPWTLADRDMLGMEERLDVLPLRANKKEKMTWGPPETVEKGINNDQGSVDTGTQDRDKEIAVQVAHRTKNLAEPLPKSNEDK